MRLALRTMFWLTLGFAVATGWVIEHREAADRLEKLTKRNRLPLLFMPPRTNEPSADSIARRKRLGELQKISDDDLLAVFASSKSDPFPFQCSDYDLCLVEMVRRRMTNDLQRAYDSLMAERASDDLRDFPQNAKLLACLRRAQGQPDPLNIHVEVKQVDWQGGPDFLPVVDAKFENVDVEKESVSFSKGGDQLGRKSARWRVHLYDARGNRVPDSNYRSWEIGGGVGIEGALPFGQSEGWENWLDARCYVQPPPAGRYKLQVIHSPDSVDIADEPDLTGLIVFQSESIDVVVSRPSGASGISVLPLLVVLSSAFVASIVAFAINRYRAATTHSPRAPTLVMGRDLLALALITLLALTWHLDIRHLNERIRASQLDEDSHWTMRLADEMI